MREFCTFVNDNPEVANARICHVYRRADCKGVAHEYIVIETANYSIRMERRVKFVYSWTSSMSPYPPVDEVR